MSEEMAVGDNASNEEHKVASEDVGSEGMDSADATEVPAVLKTAETEIKPEINENAEDSELQAEMESEENEIEEYKEIEEKMQEINQETQDASDEAARGVKRRLSTAFSDDGEEFKGFDQCEPSSLDDYSKTVEDGRRVKPRTSSDSDGFKGFDLIEHNNLTGYCQVLERLEAEVLAAAKTYTPVRRVMASLQRRIDASGCTKWSEHLEAEVSEVVRSFSTDDDSKLRKRTEGSRPSSALSSRSDGDGGVSTDKPQPQDVLTTWYTRLHRSFFEVMPSHVGQEDAKVQRRVESPVPAVTPTLESKRTPKPKPPKGASPEPGMKSPPGKLKVSQVKSMGSRLSSNGAPAAKQVKKTPQQAVTHDNNNMAAWKKPRGPPTVQPRPVAGQPGTTTPPAQLAQHTQPASLAQAAHHVQPVQPAQHIQPIHPAPAPAHAPHQISVPRPQLTPDRDVPPPLHHQNRQIQQPCSMTCGTGVPSLACEACLCLYHPACVGLRLPQDTFLCKNCRKTSSPPVEPPPLTHKSGVTSLPAGAGPGAPCSSSARRLPVPVPVPVPKSRNDKRVLLRMKVAGGGPDGERVWSVAKPGAPAPAPPPAPPHSAPTPPPSNPPTTTCRPSLPQSLVVLNGRRFIVVARAVHHDIKVRRGVSNGASPPPAAPSPALRRRVKKDDTDYFTPFIEKAKANNYNVAVQIFQYLGMRDVARAARTCSLWAELAATPALWRHVRMKNSHIFQYLGMRDVARAARTCSLWAELAATPALWRHVRMKNSHVSDWAGLCAALRRHGTRWLDLRKMLLPPNDTLFWDQFAEHIGTVDTLERLELCRCPARAVEASCERVPGLRALSAPAIRDARLDPAPLARLTRLELLRLKSLTGLSLTRDLRPLAGLSRLQHLSLTSIKELGWCACEVVGQLEQLESLELGECSFGGSFATALGKLVKLRKLRLERGVAHCAAPALLRALAALPKLTRLELVNFDVKVGFDDALAECKNIQRLLIIPTYVSQSATTNKQVLSGVLRLKETLTHLMWGVTIELLRVTELFIDQCEAGDGDTKRRDVGECIPVLKPVPGCRLPDDHRTVAGPPQVEILPIPTLQRLLAAQLPRTKLKLLRIPFHATWRQSLADFQ
ncbi:hypothetical protein KGM_216173 [Danaus plexippus plexippus]|uniref:F-box domain-containing protein n=1 Tax=Danaus plexippus plexippus TaxID=278856 RepID=A0A212FEX6_DANPL|nr:hypothetical protein KGM_216173 [Danaus plexippus plexippus]